MNDSSNLWRNMLVDEEYRRRSKKRMRSLKEMELGFRKNSFVGFFEKFVN